MIGTKTFAVMVVLAVTAGAVAGTALGVAVAVWTDRLRGVFGEVDWDGAGDE
jgi:hypothetical protein